MIKTFFAVFVLSGSAFAQLLPVSVGVKGGVPLTDAFSTVSDATRGYFSTTRRYIVGPSVELNLPAGFGVEFDALYTRLNFSQNLLAAAVATTTSNSWEFPLLLKYKFSSKGPIRPFVDAGASFRHITGVKQITSFITGSGSTQTTNPSEFRDPNATGFVIGGGVDLKLILVKVSPEIRFTHWGTENFASGVAGLLHTNRNQGQFLVGISF
jgi:opacity protein-like surface antigen